MQKSDGHPVRSSKGIKVTPTFRESPPQHELVRYSLCILRFTLTLPFFDCYHNRSDWIEKLCNITSGKYEVLNQDGKFVHCYDLMLLKDVEIVADGGMQVC